jgi:hypothetical protein
MLADGDLVSKTNCVRQPFASADVGLNKAGQSCSSARLRSTSARHSR